MGTKTVLIYVITLGLTFPHAGSVVKPLADGGIGLDIMEPIRLINDLIEWSDSDAVQRLDRYKLTVSLRPGGSIAANTIYQHTSVQINFQEIENVLKSLRKQFQTIITKAKGDHTYYDANRRHITLCIQDHEYFQQRAQLALARLQSLAKLAPRTRRGPAGWIALAWNAYQEKEIQDLSQALEQVKHTITVFAEDQIQVNELELELDNQIVARHHDDDIRAFLTHESDIAEHLEDADIDLKMRTMPRTLINETMLDQLVSNLTHGANAIPKDAIYNMPIHIKATRQAVDVIFSVPTSNTIGLLKKVKAQLTKADDDYEAFEIIVPDFVAIDQRNEWYIPMTASDLLSCQHLDEFRLYLCTERVLVKLKSENCLAAVLQKDVAKVLKLCRMRPHRLDYLEVEKRNYAFREAHKITEICPSGSVNTYGPTKFLKVNPGCSYDVGDLLQVQGQTREQTLNVQDHWFKATSIVEDQLLDHVEQRFNSSQTTVERLQDANKSLKKNLDKEVANWSSTGNLAKIAIAICIVAVLAILVLAWVCRGRIVDHLIKHSTVKDVQNEVQQINNRLGTAQLIISPETTSVYYNKAKDEAKLNLNSKILEVVQAEQDGDDLSSLKVQIENEKVE